MATHHDYATSFNHLLGHNANVVIKKNVFQSYWINLNYYLFSVMINTSVMTIGLVTSNNTVTDKISYDIQKLVTKFGTMSVTKLVEMFIGSWL